MRRILTFALVTALAISVTACGGNGESSSDSKTGSISTENNSDGNTNSDVTVEEQVLFDQDGVSVTLKGMDADGFWGPELQLETNNTTDKTVMVSARDTSINGIMMDPMFSISVAPGKISNDAMSVFGSSLKNAGVETIQTVELKFGVTDDETWESLFETDYITINTSAAGTFEQTYNDEGTEVYSDDSFRIVAQKLDSDESFWGADIYLYIENNSDKTVTIQSRDTSINGYMVDPMFSVTITPGKKAFSTITFLESDLESNGIENIDTMETSFHIYDEASMDTISDTSPVTINFN